MANFRCERLLVILDEPVRGLNHLAAVDAEEFACHFSDQIAEDAGLVPLGDFTFAPFDRPRWSRAAKGLATVRGLIGIYGRWIEQGSNPQSLATQVVEMMLEVMRQVEAVLDAADSADRRFYLAARDLE